jgi:glyoxylase-like metal-dependent hydrolase (beta-lactamase superfamily II)
MTTNATMAAHEVTGLHATAPQRLDFAPDLVVRAFLLEREAGNVLIYNTGLLEDELPGLIERGGASRQYLNHEHETLFGSDAVAHELGAKPLVHAADAAAVARRGWNGVLAFSRRHMLGDDLEVIPIPGHTPGATAYLWDSGGRRLLFTGDSVLVRDGEWSAAVLGSSDRAAYVSSLDLLSRLEFDALVPWAAGAEEPAVFPVAEGEGRRRLAEVRERVRAGADA